MKWLIGIAFVILLLNYLFGDLSFVKFLAICGAFYVVLIGLAVEEINNKLDKLLKQNPPNEVQTEQA